MNSQTATQQADRIVNMLINEFHFDLKTVDSLDIREGIVKILHPLPDTPTIGAACKVKYDGSLWNAKVTALEGESYTAVIDGTGVKMSNIPFSTWRPC